MKTVKFTVLDPITDKLIAEVKVTIDPGNGTGFEPYREVLKELYDVTNLDIFTSFE